MKFGKHLLEARPQAWRFSCMDYGGLKAFLKDRSKTSLHPWDDSSEATFIELLDKELEKVVEFEKVKKGQLSRHIEDIEKRVNKPEGQLSDSERAALLEELDKVCSDITALAKYNSLNYTAFMKIVKKHDKCTGYLLKYAFMAKLSTCTFYKNEFDSLMTPIGVLYSMVRPPSQEQEGAKEGTTCTYCYWVHPSNITELRMALVRHLPVVAYRQGDTEEATMQATISTVYLDNDRLSLYHQNLDREDGALSLRYRWYGSAAKRIYVERQIVQKGIVWSDTSERGALSLKEKYMKAFTTGEFTLDQKEAKFRYEEGRDPEEVEEMLKLGHQVQQEIRDLQLQPMVRTIFTRTGYQKPTSSRLSVYLDVDVAMVREAGRVAPHQWRRTDTAGVYPLTDVESGDVTLFPYAILEVNVRQPTAEGRLPKWMERLAANGLIQSAPHFSKFLHGCAVLLEDQAHTVPPWLPKVEGHILSSKQSARSSIQDDEFEDEESRDGMYHGSHDSVPSSGSFVSFPTSGPPSSDQLGFTVVSVKGADKGTRFSRRQSTATESSSLHNEERQPWQLLAKIRRWGHVAGDDGPASHGQRLTKPIAVPVRVEPKVFFANERTFLNWLHVAVLLTMTSMAMMNVTYSPTGGAEKGMWWTGATLGPVAIMFLLYGLYGYYRRDAMLRNREKGPYSSVVGPVLVVSVFTLVLATDLVTWIHRNGLQL